MTDKNTFPKNVQTLIDHYGLTRLPVEGTLYKRIYASREKTEGGRHLCTAIIGLYCKKPLSASCFHRLTTDELWHFYGGDAINLYLLHASGKTETITLGSDVSRGQQTIAVVPAGVWQAGEVAKGGVYGLFGCTMAPGFTEQGFVAAKADELAAQYPDMADVIKRLNTNDDITTMPKLDD